MNDITKLMAGLKMGCGVCPIVNTHELAMAAELVDCVKKSKIIRMVQPSIKSVEEILNRYGFSEVGAPAPKPTDEGLREALKKWMSGFEATIATYIEKEDKENAYCFFTEDDVKEFHGILSRHAKPEAVESLEDLAKRKGCDIRRLHPMPNTALWRISIYKEDKGKAIISFDSKRWNIADSEQAARSYLLSLPDTTGKNEGGK